MSREPLREGQWRGAADEALEQIVELGAKARVSLRLGMRRLKLLERGYERLGDIPPAEAPEAGLSLSANSNRLLSPS